MCPTTTTTTKYNQAVYFASPDFTDEYSFTDRDLQCKCKADVGPTYSLTRELLYLSLDNGLQGAYCQDNLIFDGGMCCGH